MRTALLAILVVTASATTSAADDDCSLHGDLLTTPTIPLGCPAVVYHNPESGYHFSPETTARRSSEPAPIDVTGDTFDEFATLPVWVHAIDRGTCVETTGVRALAYWKWTIELAGVQVGDTLEINNKACLQATVVEAGPCSEVIPELTWEYPPDWFAACAEQNAGDDGGCRVGGDATALLALLIVFGLVRRRA